MKQVIHLPPRVLDALRETATHADGLPDDVVVAAALSAFTRQEPAVKNFYVRHYWFEGVGEEPSQPPRRFWRALFHALARPARPAVR